MREIIFRGKDIRSGKWVEGNLILYKEPVTAKNFEDSFKNYYRIRPFDAAFEEYEVDPKTIGQWTGETDKNGVKIFEGDIVKTSKDCVRTERLKGYYGTDYEGYPQKVPGYEGYGEYQYNDRVSCLAVVRYGSRNGFYLDGASTFVGAICNEVVGNIHDNSEMLGRYK